MAKSKNVTIRELKAAAKARGWKAPHVFIYKSATDRVIWVVRARDLDSSDDVVIDAHSRQGALRMALAALRAK